MLNKIFKTIGLIALFFFSSFYTEKVLTVVKNQDPIMIEINQYKDTFDYEAIDATFDEENIIPGINGCVVDLNNSYNSMKKIGQYNVNLMVYKEVAPKLSMTTIYDKYIIKGQREKNEVALVFKMNDSKYLSDIISTLKKLKIKASFFLDGTYIEKNEDKVYKAIKAGHEIYNLGYDGKYDKDLLVWTNNLIETVSHNKSNYCLVTKKNESVLKLCGKYKMHTIKSNILINNSTNLSIIGKIIEKGSIVVFEENDSTASTLTDMVNYLNRKGYTYNLLSTHLNEKRCK